MDQKCEGTSDAMAFSPRGKAFALPPGVSRPVRAWVDAQSGLADVHGMSSGAGMDRLCGDPVLVLVGGVVVLGLAGDCLGLQAVEVIGGLLCLGRGGKDHALVVA